MNEEELNKGPQELKSEVLNGGWCVSCGACVELCPYIKSVGDRVAVTHQCDLSDGNCYKVCPRTPTDYNELSAAVTGADGDPALGSYRELYQARAADKECSDSGQYGGVITALAAMALDETEASSALLTLSKGLYPRWTLARNKEEVIAAAGSKYGVCPGLSGLNQAMRLEDAKVAVVGRSCQVTALRKMQQYSSVEGRENIGLILGIFCFWGLDYRFYSFLREEHGVGRIDYADIPKDSGLTLETDRGQISMTLDETRSFVRVGCHSCIDPTSELADISVGSTESDREWCTLLVRSESGAALVEKALSMGVMETRPAPAEALAALRSAALTKKRRVLEGGDSPPVNSDYIRLSDESRRRISKEGL